VAALLVAGIVYWALREKSQSSSSAGASVSFDGVTVEPGHTAPSTCASSILQRSGDRTVHEAAGSPTPSLAKPLISPATASAGYRRCGAEIRSPFRSLAPVHSTLTFAIILFLFDEASF
jgi:hypothetical protein